MTTPIPQPPALPFVGNVHQIDAEYPIRGLTELAKTYGELYKMNILGQAIYIVSSYALQNEVSDDKRFQKKPIVMPALLQVKSLVGDGLFTAELEAPQWGIAHRLLMPAFGTTAIRGMFDDMLDIASQLLLKWDRFGPDYVINPTADFTRLTFDTIAFCSMSHRLNSFYTEEEPKFIRAMSDWLQECEARTRRPGFLQGLWRQSNAKFEDDMATMMELSSAIVARRKASPIAKQDLLSLMLSGRDPKTGEGLSDENIAHNLLTFMIAGHETTSGMLSFALYNLLKTPDAMAKLREEVDEVIGEEPLNVAHLGKLPYMNAVFRETLRVTPSIPARGTCPKEDALVLGGKYMIPKGANILILNTATQFDPAVWGDDAEEFKPERMLDGNFEALPPNAWQPFGFGLRACIGRAFAWQEALIALALIIQRFDLYMEDPSYTLRVKSTLTIKPEGFRIHARVREGREGVPLTPVGLAHAHAKKSEKEAKPDDGVAKDAPKVYVYYGSNSGSAETFAQRIASDAPAKGFRAHVGSLDTCARRLPKDGPVVIVTASYEGEAPDNAAHFVRWVSDMKSDEASDVKYAVFGCGHKDWVKTYQRIPTLIDEQLEKGGAIRLLPRGEGNAAGPEFFEAFDTFEADLWETLQKEYTTANTSTTSTIDVQTVDAGHARALALRQVGTTFGKVIQNKVLSASGVPTKRHIAFELPKNLNYQSGDYLAILPTNPARDVSRALARFDLSAETEVIISSTGPTSLPVKKPVSLSSVLSGYVELSQPATTRDLRLLLEAPSSNSTKDALQSLLANHTTVVLAKRLSVLDILEVHPDIQLSLGAFLDLLPSMRVRQYSISSSPLADSTRVTITLSVLDAPATSGRTTPFLGVASNFLHNLAAGDKVQLAVRSSRFHLPTDARTPVVMVCAGSGIAPFRGFVQERAAQKAAGREVGRMFLFFGCRAPEMDYLYAESELKQWEEAGVVEVRPAFSRKTEESEGCKYVQDRLWQDREDVAAAFKDGAKFYVCGSRAIAAGVKEKLLDVIKTCNEDTEDAEARQWFERSMQGRYATDIFE